MFGRTEKGRNNREGFPLNSLLQENRWQIRYTSAIRALKKRLVFRKMILIFGRTEKGRNNREGFPLNSLLQENRWQIRYTSAIRALKKRLVFRKMILIFGRTEKWGVIERASLSTPFYKRIDGRETSYGSLVSSGGILGVPGPYSKTACHGS